MTLLGRPLLWWSVRAALDAETVTRTIVSTDDSEIADAAATAGAEVPFLRPAELAGDTVLDLPVFEHALRTLAASEGYAPDLVVHLRPTSPLRPPGLVDEGSRAVWEMRRVEVMDGGPDGDVDTADNTVFARQGVFVP